MKRSINSEEAKVIWGLDKWYEKTAYVFGVASLIFWGVCFTIGVIVGIVEEANTSGVVQDSVYSEEL